MTNIPVQFSQDAEGRPVLALEINSVMVHDPLLSECGRFVADPLKTYGIPGDLAEAVRTINMYLDAGWLKVAP